MPPRPPADLVAELRAAGCVFAEDEARLLHAAAATPDELAAMTRRRTGGDPLEVILGWAHFHGHRIAVDPDVFVPRRRSQHLVDQALTRATPDATVVELCCGTGAITTAIGHALRAPELHAADLDPAATLCAHRNVTPLGGHTHTGDLYDPLPTDLRGRVDLLIANAPYVPTTEIGTMPPEAREHEPTHTLDGGPDGLDLHRRIAADAPSWLAPGGHLLVETSRDQADRAADILTAHGLHTHRSHSTDLDATVVTGSRPDRPGQRWRRTTQRGETRPPRPLP